MDDELKTKMTEAYISGDYPKALKLSQELDKQVVKEQKVKTIGGDEIATT